MSYVLRSFKGRSRIVPLVLGAALAAASFIVPALAITQAGPLLVQDTTDPYAIEGINTSNGGIGVEGYGSFAGATGVTGVLGYVISPNSTGVTGYADNAGTAYGIYGFATNGNGVYGVSNSSSAASIYGANANGGPGVYGYSSGPGYGVLGISTVINGVAGITRSGSTSSSYAGIAGYDQSTAGSHYGVYGMSGKGTAGYFSSDSGIAVVGNTTASTSGVGDLGLPSGVGVLAYGYGTGAAMQGYEYGTGPILQLGKNAFPSSTNAFMVQSTTMNRSNVALASGVDVQISGDLYVYGKMYSDCNAYPATGSTSCYNTALGAYGTTSEERRPDGTSERVGTAEDVGSARLVDGAGFVPISASFAGRMAPGRPYVVFLTPEGDCRGLYVVRKTPAGFAVRESQGGRSTLAFSYRIVGTAAAAERKKFGSTVKQEPLANPKLLGAPSGSVLGREPRRLARPHVPHLPAASRR